MSGGGFVEVAFLSVKDCQRNLRDTAPGHSFCFYIGETLDNENPTVKLVLQAIAEGRYSKHFAGRDDLGRLRHVARRVESAKSENRGKGAVRRRAGLDPAGPEMAIYAVLCDAAARGIACPSNSQLADMADHPKAWTARDAGRAYEKLVALGMVRVVEPARYGPRVIEIVATGKRTASASMNGVAA